MTLHTRMIENYDRPNRRNRQRPIKCNRRPIRSGKKPDIVNQWSPQGSWFNFNATP